MNYFKWYLIRITPFKWNNPWVLNYERCSATPIFRDGISWKSSRILKSNISYCSIFYCCHSCIEWFFIFHSSSDFHPWKFSIIFCTCSITCTCCSSCNSMIWINSNISFSFSIYINAPSVLNIIYVKDGKKKYNW